MFQLSSERAERLPRVDKRRVVPAGRTRNLASPVAPGRDRPYHLTNSVFGIVRQICVSFKELRNDCRWCNELLAPDEYGLLLTCDIKETNIIIALAPFDMKFCAHDRELFADDGLFVGGRFL